MDELRKKAVIREVGVLFCHRFASDTAPPYGAAPVFIIHFYFF
jgi:hypothetical protein